MKRTRLYLLILLIALAIVWYINPENHQDQVVEPPAPAGAEATQSPPENVSNAPETIDPQGHYSSRDDVARYLFTYGELPPNFITKNEARELGWVAEQGNLWDVTDNYSIGGDRFYNREKLLPEENGRIWYECDIDYQGGRRGAKRMVYSNDGLIYYTDDHYESFQEIREDEL
ncbi:MAG: ribonuclease [Tissierellia bacterium]|jgi:guanyl-specific ribonuclease Sa|nr:ribonuclease [Tissierellia bacterium]